MVRVVGALLTISLTLAGALDLTRALRRNGEDLRLFSMDEMAVADWLRRSTPKDAILLAVPTYNQPMVLTGRTMVLGYPGHIWSHGMPALGRQREADIREMSHESERSADLWARYRVSHILFGPREENDNWDKMLFERKTHYVGSLRGYQLFETGGQPDSNH
jgi:hypothetical protein